MDKFRFGYPRKCTQCEGVKFGIEPFYQEGNDIRLMLIGQDPTIARQQERVRQVLMLDQENGQIKRWLREIFGAQFDSLTIYGTNLIKCSFDRLPSLQGGANFLSPYFLKCKAYLINEVKNYKPSVVFAFGEPAHQFFRTLFKNQEQVPKSMQNAFKGGFYKTSLEDVSFDYFPCLHIKTYRVGDVYGEAVKQFKVGLVKYFGDRECFPR